MKIVFPEGPAPKLAIGIRCYTEDGHEIDYIKHIRIDATLEGPLIAEVTLLVGGIENLSAHPLLAIETVKEAAARYGYCLIPHQNNYAVDPRTSNTYINSSAPVCGVYGHLPSCRCRASKQNHS